MEARVIVIICNLVEPEIHVRPGSDPFGTVNRAGFEGSDDLATSMASADLPDAVVPTSARCR